MHTWVLNIVLGVGEDLQWTNKVHGVHPLMHGNEDLDWLIRAVLLNDCTHRAGIGI